MVTWSLASMLTLKAVPRRLVLWSTIGAIPSSSSRRATIGMQTRPGSVPGHEADVLGRDQLRRDDEVAFVLAVLVVDDDHELAGFEIRDRLGNGGQAHGHQILLAQVSSHVPGYDVGFEVDHRPGLVRPPRS